MSLMGMIIFYSAIVEAFSVIFSNYMNQSMCPDIWKRSSLSAINKKCDKQ